ncbi:Retrovirus-related Pol polyprotein from transposon TNT 1-94 [Vitis vinifera]|uniref:Retrovirus-related Pol polyprotein from transposon TNT 1-94 n=1 Tax=Vitis vinifera TaxID=29760 RepID=A0A438FPK6_VITVI|nr:Retrovirus-related Pol polyprotein from transposon TNT 1-94 [Vitis vinifera]
MDDEIEAIERNDTWELTDLPKGHKTIGIGDRIGGTELMAYLPARCQSAFLLGNLEEQVFVEQPLGRIKIGNEHKVYRLKKALYGLKQAPQAWFSRIEAYFLKEGFHKCPYEHTLFVKIGDKGKMFIGCLYVDDLIFTGNDDVMFKEFKKSMMVDFEMFDPGYDALLSWHRSSAIS